MMPPPGGWASKGTPPWEAAMPASAAAAIIKVVGSVRQTWLETVQGGG